MTSKKYAGIDCNEKFLEIHTCSDSGWIQDDPLGEDIYLEPLADNKNVGEAILKALSKSRDVSISEEDRQLYIEKKITRADIFKKYPDQEMFEIAACMQRYKEWQQRVMKEYGYKTKKALMQNMQHVSVEDNGETILFTPTNHETIEGFSGVLDELNVVIPTTSMPEIIGAATRYAIGNCRGKGSDFMRELLFPNGQPETFDEYLESLRLKN